MGKKKILVYKFTKNASFLMQFWYPKYPGMRLRISGSGNDYQIRVIRVRVIRIANPTHKKFLVIDDFDLIR